MAEITYRLTDGSARVVAIEAGTSVRDAALDQNIPGIDGECGGYMNCATCHVYVDPDWYDKLPDPSELEDELLEGAAAQRLPTSRLSCQLVVSDEWAGLVVQMPESQY